MEPTFAVPGQALTQAERAIHEQALSSVADFKRVEAGLLKAVIAVDRSRLFEKFSQPSTYAYCTRILGLSEDIACTFIAVARASHRAPALSAAVEKGWLSVSKARKVCGVINETNQDEWVENARRLSRAALELEVARLNPREIILERLRPVSATMHKLEVGMNQEAVDFLRRAQDLLSSSEARPATFEETILAALKLFVHGHDPIEKAKRSKSRANAKSVKVNKDSTPAHVQHQVNLRDQRKCRAVDKDGVICGSTRWLQFHHIVPKNLGGSDTPENLITLCGFHHRLYHKCEDRPPP